MHGGGDDDNDMGSIAMPGFIDILATVIVMFVFFVTVIAIMLYVHTIKYKAEVEAKMEERIKQEITEFKENVIPEDSREQVKLVEDMKEKLKKAEIELEQLKTSTAQTIEEKEETNSFDTGADVDSEEVKVDETSAHNTGAVQVATKDTNKLTVVFPLSVTDIDEASKASVNEAVQKAQERYKNSRVVIRSIMGSESYSAARRLAYYRILIIRNLLIEQGIAAERISSTISESGSGQNGSVEVFFAEDR